MFDNDEYIMNNREIYGDLDSQFAGKIAYSEEDVLENLNNYFLNPKLDSDKRDQLLHFTNSYNKNDNCGYIFKFLEKNR